MSLGVPNDRRFPSLQQSIQEDTSPTSYTGLDSFVSTGAAFSFQQVPTNPSTPSKAFATGGPLAPTSSPFAKKAGAAPAINIMNTMQQDGLADLDMDLMTDDNQPHNDGDFDIDLDVGEAKYDDGDIDLDVDVNFNDQMMGFGQENDYQMAGAGQGGGNIAVEEADDVMVDEMGDAHQQQQQQQQDDEMIPDEPNVQGGAVTVVESTSLTVEMSTAPAPSSPLPMDDQSSPVIAYQTLATQTQTQTPTQTQQPFPPSTADTAPFQSHEGPSGNTQVDNSVTPTKPLSPPSHQSSQTQPPTHFSPPPPTQTPQFSPSHNAAPAETHFSPPVQQPVYNSPPIQRPDDSAHPSQTDLNNIQQQQQPPLPSPSLVGNVTSPLVPPVDAPTENSRNSTPPAPVVPVEENQQEQQDQKHDGEDAAEESHEEYRYNQEFENHELDDQDFNNEVDNDNFNHEDDHKNEVVEEVDEQQDEQAQEVDQQGYPADAHHQEADQNGHEAAYEERAGHNNIEDLPEEIRVSQAETAKLEESPEVPQREWAQHPHAVNKVETAHIHHEQGNYQLDVATSIATEVAEEETSHELERGSPTPTDHPKEESHEHAATPPQDGSYEEDAPAEENANDEHVEHTDEEYHQEYPSHPIVVLYKDTEYSLYHDEKNNNVANIPQSFILADNTLTGKSFSHTMAALREVMVNELDPNDEIVLKVKDLGLTFEEHNSQNNDITVFHLTDLFLQLSSQDRNDEPGPLYCELQRRPRYLTKLDMLKNHVLAGGGLASLKKDHAPVQDEYANGTDTANEQGPTHDEKEDVNTSQHEGDEDLELEEFEKVPEEELLGQDEIQQTEASDKKAEEKDELELSEEEYETLQNADDLEDSVVVGGKYNDAASKDGDQNKQVDNDEGEQFDFEDDHQAETGGGEEGDDSLIGFDEELGQRESTGKQNTGQPSASAVNKTAGNKQSEEDDDILDVVQVKSRPLKSKVDDDDDIGEAITVQKSPAKPSVSTRSHHHKSNSNSKAAPAKPANPAPAKDWIKLGEPYDDDSKDADGDDDDFNFDINDNDVPVKSGNNGSAKHNGGDASLDFYDDNTFEEEGAEFSVYPDLRDSPPIGDHINVAPAGEKRARDEEEGDTIVVNPGFYSASKRRRAS